jgi:hypothetical protein
MPAGELEVPAHDPPASSLRSALRAVLRHRGVRVAFALWVVGYVVVLWLARGSLPFDRPAVAGLPFAAQMAGPTVGMIEIFGLMVVAFLLTRGRSIPDMGARAPATRIAKRETVFILAYAALGQAGGWVLGSALGFRPFSFHIAGTVFGCTVTPGVAEMWIWALYNFLVFAVAPYLYFCRRYSNAELNLASSNRRSDLLMILVIMVLESIFELAFLDNNILRLNSHQILLGAPLAFGVFFIGTVLPTMILIYAILLPRYMRLTGSAVSTVLLGGLTYAAMHIVEGWSVFDSPRDIALSLLFVLFQYVGPGMMKSVLTLRTGNAWVHAFGYHAVPPHLIVDTPLVVKILGIV